MSSAGLLGALNQPFNELRSLIPTTTPTTMFTDSNKAPTYSYNLPVIGSHAPPVFGSRTLPVIGSHTQPVIGPHTQPVIRSHTQPVIGSHTLPVIGSHTQSFQNLFNPPKHQLLPNSPTFVGRSTNEQYQAAANMLGMSMNSLKTLCLDYKIQRWPHRKLASIDILLETGPVLESNPTKRQRLTSLLHSLRQGILDDPNLPIPEEVEKTRQRLYKRRHLEQARMGSSQTTQTV
eukprot:gene13228-19069_t